MMNSIEDVNAAGRAGDTAGETSAKPGAIPGVPLNEPQPPVLLDFTVNEALLARELRFAKRIAGCRRNVRARSGADLPDRNLLIEVDSGGMLKFTAAGEAVWFQSTPPGRVSCNVHGAVAVSLPDLTNYLRLRPGAELRVTAFGPAGPAGPEDQNQNWNGKCFVRLARGSSDSWIAGMLREHYLVGPKAGSWIDCVPMELLTGLIGMTGFAMPSGKGNSGFLPDGVLLTSVSCDIREPGETAMMAMVATDGHRLSFAELTDTRGVMGKPVCVLLPRPAVDGLERIAAVAGKGAPVEFGLSGDHLFFRVGSYVLISRRTAGTFPDYKRVLGDSRPYRAVVSREEFQSLVERVALVSPDQPAQITIRLMDGKVTACSQPPGAKYSGGEPFRMSLPAHYSGPAAEIGLNAQYLLDCLSVIGEPRVALYFDAPVSDPASDPASGDSSGAGPGSAYMPVRSAVEIRPFTNRPVHGQRYLIMPLRGY